VRSRFVVTSFFLIAADVYYQSLCGFFGVATVNIFSSMNRNDANVTGEYFSATVLNG